MDLKIHHPSIDDDAIEWLADHVNEMKQSIQKYDFKV